jgi:hypothetical protein
LGKGQEPEQIPLEDVKAIVREEMEEEQRLAQQQDAQKQWHKDVDDLVATHPILDSKQATFNADVADALTRILTDASGNPRYDLSPRQMFEVIDKALSRTAQSAETVGAQKASEELARSSSLAGALSGGSSVEKVGDEFYSDTELSEIKENDHAEWLRIIGNGGRRE